MRTLRAVLSRVTSLLRRGRSGRGSEAGGDFGSRLDASRNDAHRRGQTSQQGPTWGGGPF